MITTLTSTAPRTTAIAAPAPRPLPIPKHRMLNRAGQLGKGSGGIVNTAVMKRK